MVITSLLPLTMVKAQFKKREFMTVDELETFIPFMAKCAFGKERFDGKESAPSWWNSSIPFKFPLLRPNTIAEPLYRDYLSTIVANCYSYYQQDYLLEFCSQIAMDPSSVVMKRNHDDTTSIFYAKTLVHILTFNNENKYYDSRNLKRPRGVVTASTSKSPKKSLLAARRPKPVQITELYLCENCDEEFTSQTAINAHERKCYKSSSQPEEELNCETSQPESLLSYLKLGTINEKASKQEATVVYDLCLVKMRSLEFSSPLGQRILAQGGKRDVATKPEKLVQQYESYCFVSLRDSKTKDCSDMRKLRATYKPRLQSRSAYSRTYCFSSRERRERYMTLKTGLNKKSRLLLRQMQKCSVVVERLKHLAPLPPCSPLLICLESSGEESSAELSPVQVTATTTTLPSRSPVKSGDEQNSNIKTQVGTALPRVVLTPLDSLLNTKTNSQVKNNLEQRHLMGTEVNANTVQIVKYNQATKPVLSSETIALVDLCLSDED